MYALATAVVVASVLGSLHCVGMCGPFALWAAGVEQPRGRRTVWARMSMYHLGRLVTYLTAGALAGLAASLVSAGGQQFGIQSAASRVVGVALLALGVVRFSAFFWHGNRGAGQPNRGHRSPTGGKIAGWLAGLRPRIVRLPATLRAGVIGGLTTLLPCGWLYLFVLVAAGTGDVLSAMTVMLAFWAGTLPALTMLVAGARSFASRARPAMPALGALMLIATGLYTTTGRAAADLAPLQQAADRVSLSVDEASDASRGDAQPTTTAGAPDTDASRARATLKELSETPLPCCQHGN